MNNVWETVAFYGIIPVVSYYSAFPADRKESALTETDKAGFLRIGRIND